MFPYILSVLCVWLVCTDVVALAAAVTELLQHTRRARTALWCAVQLTSAECAAACLTDITAARDPASPHRSTVLSSGH